MNNHKKEQKKTTHSRRGVVSNKLKLFLSMWKRTSRKAQWAQGKDGREIFSRGGAWPKIYRVVWGVTGVYICVAGQGTNQLIEIYAIICMENLEDSQIYRQSNHDHNHCLVLSHCSIIHYGFPELNRLIQGGFNPFMERINWGRLTFFCGELKYYIIRNVVLNRENTNSTIFTHL